MPNTPDASQDLVPQTGKTITALLNGTLKLPAAITQVINVQSWAHALVKGEKYEEPNPNYLSQMLLLQTLASETLDELFAQQGIKKLQDAIPNVPGAGTGPIEIRSIYVTESDFEEGFPTYLIIEAVSLTHGLELRYTTGAGQIQAQLMVALCHGFIPMKCQITRTDRKDKGGRYMFWLIPPDTQDATG